MKSKIMAIAIVGVFAAAGMTGALANAKPPMATPTPQGEGVITVPGDYDTIQGAIDAAEDGDRIVVSEGTYEELLTIDGKDITLVANGDVTIRNPQPDETIADRRDTVMVSNARCTIEGFTIDVNGGWGGIYASGGPYYETGEVVLTAKNNKVMDYERNGITANGELATGRFIQNNMVIGQKDSYWANNGIQIGWGATGIIKGNTVETNYWIGEEWTASGIMVFDAKDVMVTGNTVKDCETGIYVLGINNKVVNNNLENELEEDMWGIVIGDPEPYLGWGLTYEECTNNKVIHNTIVDYTYDIVDLSEDSKVHANVISPTP